MPGSRDAKPLIGPAGRNVVQNIEQLRSARRLSLRNLSERLGSRGHPMPTSAVHAITQGKRRVDADDLAVLAEVLGVTAADLLLSPGELDADPPEDHAAIREARNLTRRIESLLAASGNPESCELASGYVDRALRRVQIEVEELAETRGSRSECQCQTMRPAPAGPDREASP